MIRRNRGKKNIVPFSQRKEMLWAIRFVRICRLYSRILRSYTGDREKGCVFLRDASLFYVAVILLFMLKRIGISLSASNLSAFMHKQTRQKLKQPLLCIRLN